MSNYADYAKDLRALALTLELLEPDLPAPCYASRGLTIRIFVPEARDVTQAAKALNVGARIDRGHTTTTAHYDTVTLEFVHVDAPAMADYEARTSYSQNLQVTS